MILPSEILASILKYKTKKANYDWWWKRAGKITVASEEKNFILQEMERMEFYEIEKMVFADGKMFLWDGQRMKIYRKAFNPVDTKYFWNPLFILKKS